jgi:flagellar hook-associated protein 2
VSSFETPTFTVGGLASGLDTNQIISQLMAIERRPRTRLEQRQKVEEARQTALRDIQTRLRNLQSAAAALRDAATWGDRQTVETSDATRVSARRVGGAAAGGYTIQVDGLARAAQTTQGTSLSAAAAADTLRITVGATTVDVAITAGDSLQTIADRINGTSDVPVYASVVSGKLVLSGKETGAANTISVADGDTANAYDLATALGFAQSQAPADADFWLNGVHVTDRASNVVTDALVGVELTLKATTGGATIGVSVGTPGPDTEAVQAKVQAFVEQYNSTLDFIRSKLEEERVANPRTDAERAKGTLRGDPGLTMLLSRMRQAVSDVFTGGSSDIDQLSEVGLTTGASTGASALNRNAVAGMLTLDAAKLAEKLASDFGKVRALFTKVTGTYATEGLSQRLARYLDPWLQGDGTNAAFLGSRITASQQLVGTLKDQMASIDLRLAQRERALRLEFTAMERALQQARDQGTWLQGQLGTLPY